MKPFVIDFRNAKYQGAVKDLQPEGIGICLDEQMRLIISNWRQGMVDGKSLIFYSHAKYIYGDWREGQPHGINVFRSGDTILFACVEYDTIIGQFLVIFEQQQLAVRVEIVNGTCSILERKDGLTSKEDVRRMADQTRFPRNLSDDYFSLTSFINASFKSQEARTFLKFEEDQGNYFLGYSDGLGIVFDNDNFIKTRGVLNEKLQPKSIGAKFTVPLSEQGDFETGEVVKYTNRFIRPAEQITSLFRKTQIRSMEFLNGYLSLNVEKPLTYIDNTLKSKLISQVAQQQLQDSIRYSPEDLNDSLEYQQRGKQDGERLRKMREELYKSIGRPGAQIVTSPKKKEYRPAAEVITESSPSPYRLLSQKENVHKHTTSKYQNSPPSVIHLQPVPVIGIDRNELITQNRVQDYLAEQIKYDNLQERRERLLKDYKNLRAETIAPTTPFILPWKMNDKLDSPGRKLNMDTEREILNTISSSRHYAPILHDKPPLHHIPHKPISPPKKKLDFVDIRRARQHDSYKAIHLKEDRTSALTPIKQKHSVVDRDIRPTKKPQNTPSPVTRSGKEPARDKSSAKKYSYLAGIDL